MDKSNQYALSSPIFLIYFLVRRKKRSTISGFGARLLVHDDLKGDFVKDVQGRDMARLGDSTDHGGKVIQAADNLTHLGIRAALDGHLAECPKCGGNLSHHRDGRADP